MAYNIQAARRWDRLATVGITGGGLLIIIAVVGILFLIASVALPLFGSPGVTEVHRTILKPGQSPDQVVAIGVDDYLENVAWLDKAGTFHFGSITEHETFESIKVEPPADPNARIRDIEIFRNWYFNILWDDGGFTTDQLKFLPHFDDDGNRTIHPKVERIAEAKPDDASRDATRALARVSEEGSVTRVTRMADNRIRIDRVTQEVDIFGTATPSTSSAWIEDTPDDTFKAIALSRDGSSLVAGTTSGRVFRWQLPEDGDPLQVESVQLFDDGRRLTELAFVLGDVSIAVGDDRGGYTTWFPVRSGDGNQRRYRKIHDLKTQKTPIVQITPSMRNKSLLSVTEGGALSLDHMTSERHLLNIEEDSPFLNAGLSNRGNGVAAVNARGEVVVWELDNPHPEVSTKALFGRVWYEGYDEPTYTWQSSSASNDFEPKLSLMPLLFGSIKATLYAMLFAVPLGILGAIYSSQLMHPAYRRWIKPAVEIMAAIPSVVIGFLAALWFAPIVEAQLVPLFLWIVIFPVALIGGVMIWRLVVDHPRVRPYARGHEFLFLIPVFLLAGAACYFIGHGVEAWAFDGSMKQWIFNEFGERFDQRNSIVIAFALGFAVIPIIFTMADDALMNVPRHLSAASYALGASRWQTVWRVVLPCAIPGIFAAVMIGLGRAIGETMIVLMATGNTPVMDAGPFNGMRTLSANIAVEIPEAPHGGTLYRILFLSAVLLFVMTFLINTVAEFVRQQLRKKYKQL